MKKKIFILITTILITFFFIQFFNQNRELKKYDQEISMYKNQIQNLMYNQNNLKETVESINTLNYVEETARNKLEMYLPNERIYIDTNN